MTTFSWLSGFESRFKRLTFIVFPERYFAYEKENEERCSTLVDPIENIAKFCACTDENIFQMCEKILNLVSKRVGT